MTKSAEIFLLNYFEYLPYWWYELVMLRMYIFFQEFSKFDILCTLGWALCLIWDDLKKKFMPSMYCIIFCCPDLKEKNDFWQYWILQQCSFLHNKQLYEGLFLRWQHHEVTFACHFGHCTSKYTFGVSGFGGFRKTTTLI